MSELLVFRMQQSLLSCLSLARYEVVNISDSSYHYSIGNVALKQKGFDRVVCIAEICRYQNDIQYTYELMSCSHSHLGLQGAMDVFKHVIRTEAPRLHGLLI